MVKEVGWVLVVDYVWVVGKVVVLGGYYDIVVCLGVGWVGFGWVVNVFWVVVGGEYYVVFVCLFVDLGFFFICGWLFGVVGVGVEVSCC